MPVINKRVVMTANGTSQPLVGSVYEFLGFPALIEGAVQADATGVLMSFSSGSDILAEENTPVQVGTINVQPKYPDDFYLRDMAAPGDRLTLNLRDTTGAVRTVMVSIRITPLG